MQTRMAGQTGGEDNDYALLVRLGRREHEALAALYDRHGRVVYSVALRILKDPALAEDVLQEIYLQLWRDPGAFHADRGSLPAWLAVLARNRSIDVLRRRRLVDGSVSGTLEELELPSPGNLADIAEHNLLLSRTHTLIQRLPLEQQQSLAMAFADGLTHSEIAERTGIPLGTVKTRIRRALQALRREAASA